MYDTSEQFQKIKKDVLQNFPRFFNKLVKAKNLKTKFITAVESENHWDWFYITAIGVDNKEHKIAYRVSSYLFTRNSDATQKIDIEAKIDDKQDNLANYELVCLRMVYQVFSVIKDIEDNKFPLLIKNPDCWFRVIPKLDGTLGYDYTLKAPIEY